MKSLKGITAAVAALLILLVIQNCYAQSTAEQPIPKVPKVNVDFPDPIQDVDVSTNIDEIMGIWQRASKSLEGLISKGAIDELFNSTVDLCSALTATFISGGCDLAAACSYLYTSCIAPVSGIVGAVVGILSSIAGGIAAACASLVGGGMITAISYCMNAIATCIVGLPAGCLALLATINSFLAGIPGVGALFGACGVGLGLLILTPVVLIGLAVGFALNFLSAACGISTSGIISLVTGGLNAAWNGLNSMVTAAGCGSTLGLGLNAIFTWIATLIGDITGVSGLAGSVLGNILGGTALIGGMIGGLLGGVVGGAVSIAASLCTGCVNLLYSTGVGGIAILALAGTMLNFLGTAISLVISAGVVLVQILTGLANLFFGIVTCGIFTCAPALLNLGLSLVAMINVVVMELHNLMMDVIATPFGFAAWATLLADIVPLLLQLVVLGASVVGVIIALLPIALLGMGIALLFALALTLLLKCITTNISVILIISIICCPCGCLACICGSYSGVVPLMLIIIGELIIFLISTAFSAIYSMLNFFALAILTAFNTIWIVVEDIWSFLMMIVNVAVLSLLRILADIVAMTGISVVVSFIFTAVSHVLSLCEGMCMSCCSSLTGGALGLGSTIALGETIATIVVFLNRFQQYAPISRIVLYPLEACAGVAMLIFAAVLAALNILCYPFNFIWSNLYHFCCAPFVRPLGWSE